MKAAGVFDWQSLFDDELRRIPTFWNLDQRLNKYKQTWFIYAITDESFIALSFCQTNCGLSID